jgi:hypothetical protein
VSEQEPPDLALLLPLRVTTHGADSRGRWLDTPGIPHQDHQPVDPELGRRLLEGLENLPPRADPEDRP